MTLKAGGLIHPQGIWKGPVCSIWPITCWRSGHAAGSQVASSNCVDVIISEYSHSVFQFMFFIRGLYRHIKRLYWYTKSVLMDDKDILDLHDQYHEHWWPRDGSHRILAANAPMRYKHVIIKVVLMWSWYIQSYILCWICDACMMSDQLELSGLTFKLSGKHGTRTRSSLRLRIP